jgi:hypothetical protein
VLPIGTAAWTGIGSPGTNLMGGLRFGIIALVVLSIVALKVA